MKKILIIVTCLVISFSLAGCKEDFNYKDFEVDTYSSNVYDKIVVDYIAEVNRQSDVILDTTNTIDYVIPGNGTVVSASSQKNALDVEVASIFNYDMLDSKGYYYVDGVNTSTQLFKHRGADNQVSTYLSDDSAVTKTMTLRNSIYPSSETDEIIAPVNVTGLYAPAGEIIKIEISEELLETNPKVYIGSTATNGKVNDIPNGDTYTRMPINVKELTLTDLVNYVGSPLGGQIYIQSSMKEYSVTITGGVEYFHYIEGTTTKEELVSLYDSTAPMIDIEIPGLLRVNMPRSELTSYETTIYNELIDSFSEEEARTMAMDTVIDAVIDTANTWKMYCELSTYICPEDLYKSNNVTIFFDSYVVFENFSSGNCFSTFSIANGRNFLNVDYDNISFLENYNLHMYNNEAFVEQGSNTVTSNILTILSMMLYGTYGEYRTLSSNSHTYSNAYETLRYVKAYSSTEFEISKYVTLMHSFGAQTFIDALSYDVNISSLVDKLYIQFSYATGFDMLYYFQDVIGWEINGTYISQIEEKNYNMYIPIASSLQIGQVVNNKKIYNTQNLGLSDFELININESISVPIDMEFSIINIADPNGVVEVNNGVYYYKLDAASKDEFVVTVNAYNDEYSYTADIIMGIAESYSNQVINNPTTIYYNNYENLSLDEINYSDLEVNTIITSVSDTILKNGVNTGYNGVFLTYANLYLPESKIYTINAWGLGDIKISVGTNYNNLEVVARFKQEGSASTSDASDESRTFEIDSTLNRHVIVKIEVSSVDYNSLQRVEFGMGYVSGSSVTAIPAGWWYNQYSSNLMTTSYVTQYTNNGSTLDNVNYDELSINAIFEPSSIGNANYTYGQSGIFVSYGYIVLPEEKSYTFTLAGQGDIKVSIGSAYDSLEEVVRYSNFGNNSTYDVNNESRSFTIDGTTMSEFIIKIEIYSSARATLYLGYINDSGSVVDVPASMWYGYYSSNEIITPEYNAYYNESLYSPSKYVTSYTTIEEDVAVIYQTGKLDSKFLTTPNSEAQSVDPGSIFIYRYEEEVTANYFTLYSGKSGSGIISFFEIYVSSNGVNWTEAFNGVTDNDTYSGVDLDQGYTFQYVKLVFSSQYSGNYIEICNFGFQLRCNELQVLNIPTFNMSYTGSVDIINNRKNLNGNFIEFDDKIKFTFTGSSLLLFCNMSNSYGIIEVTIDGVSYEIDLSDDDAVSKQVLALSYLSYGSHEVVIKATKGLGNIDFIAVQ